MKWYYLLAIVAATALVTMYVTKMGYEKCPDGKTYDAATKSCK
jgi:hypothetical protein